MLRSQIWIRNGRLVSYAKEEMEGITRDQRIEGMNEFLEALVHDVAHESRKDSQLQEHVDHLAKVQMLILG